jgi:hypothetical protein
VRQEAVPIRLVVIVMITDKYVVPGNSLHAPIAHVWLGEVRLADGLGTALSLPALIKGDLENLSPTHAAVGRFVPLREQVAA